MRNGYMLYTMKFAYRFGGVTMPIYKGEGEVSGNFADTDPLYYVEEILTIKAGEQVRKNCCYKGTPEITKLDLNGN